MSVIRCLTARFFLRPLAVASRCNVSVVNFASTVPLLSLCLFYFSDRSCIRASSIVHVKHVVSVPPARASPAPSAPSQRRRVKPQRRRASELQLTYVRASLSTANNTHIPSTNSTLPPANMFARRAVSSVARRAVVARPVVPVRSFASSVRRCEFCWLSLPSGLGKPLGQVKRRRWSGRCCERLCERHWCGFREFGDL